MFSAQGANLAFGLDEERIRLDCEFKEDMPGWGHLDVCARSIKQLNSKILLQRLDLEAHSRLRKIQSSAALRKLSCSATALKTTRRKLLRLAIR